jgi:hypothetical protein
MFTFVFHVRVRVQKRGHGGIFVKNALMQKERTDAKKKAHTNGTTFACTGGFLAQRFRFAWSATRFNSCATLS